MAELEQVAEECCTRVQTLSVDTDEALEVVRAVHAYADDLTSAVKDAADQAKEQLTGMQGRLETAEHEIDAQVKKSDEGFSQLRDKTADALSRDQAQQEGEHAGFEKLTAQTEAETTSITEAVDHSVEELKALREQVTGETAAIIERQEQAQQKVAALSAAAVAAKEGIEGRVAALREAFGAFSEGLQGQLSQTTSGLGETGEQVTTQLEELKSAVTQQVEQLVGALKEIFEKVVGALGEPAQQIGEAFSALNEVGNQGCTEAIETIEGVLDKVREILDLVEKIKPILDLIDW